MRRTKGSGTCVLAGGFAVLAVIALAACRARQAEIPAGFAQALRAARHLTSPRHLRRSGYMAAARSRRPSEVIAYLFSEGIGVRRHWGQVFHYYN